MTGRYAPSVAWIIFVLMDRNMLVPSMNGLTRYPGRRNVFVNKAITERGESVVCVQQTIIVPGQMMAGFHAQITV